MKTVEVVAAIIVNDREFLCVQRGESPLDYISRKYEFPGGKIEVGETHEEALIRELYEELCIDVVIEKLFLSVEHSYPDFKLVMHSYLCSAGSRNLQLTEHLEARWLPVDELETLDWAGADLPIVEKLKDIYEQSDS